MPYCVICNVEVDRDEQPCKFGCPWPCDARVKMMERHTIDGHEVLLPVGTKAMPPWKEGDPLPDLGGCYD